MNLLHTCYAAPTVTLAELVQADKRAESVAARTGEHLRADIQFCPFDSLHAVSDHGIARALEWVQPLGDQMRKLIIAAVVGFLWKRLRGGVTKRRWSYPVSK